MRIGIDARFYGPGGQGLGRYVEQLLINLGQNESNDSYFIFVRPDAPTLSLPKNFFILSVPYRWYGWSEQLIWPLYLTRLRLDVMHFTHFNVPFLYPRRFIVTIHDLILFHFPSAQITTRNLLFFKIKYRVFRFIIRCALLRAVRIITVSNFSANDIKHFFPFTAKKIRVIYEGANYDSRKTELVDRSEKDREPIILYVGNAYPHKNLDFLITNFIYWQHSHPKYFLYLVGKKDIFYSRLQTTPANTPSIIFVSEVSDRALQQLYRRAQAYVFPSLYEGFGLPGLEAMSNGLPVISSNAASLPEIFGDAAAYFDPTNRDDFLTKLSHVTEDSRYRLKLIAAGYYRIKRYSWRDMAKKTRVLYAEAKK